MRRRLLQISTLLLAGTCAASPAARHIAIEWSEGRPQGRLDVTDGSVVSLAVTGGKGSVEGKDRFRASQDGPFRLEIEVDGADVRYGPGGTIVTVATARNPFSFLLRDVRRDYPIYIPGYQVVVVDAADARPYPRVEAAIRGRGLQSKLERIESEPEETFDIAAANTRSVSCQTWLGLSRDMRIFALGERLDWIQPRFHGVETPLPETGGKPTRYNFMIGRGWGPRDRITRRLEEGVLPVLNGTLLDEEIAYSVSAFVGLESKPLTAQNVRGSHFLAADGHGRGHMFTKEQQAEFDRLLPAEMNQPEETVFHLRVTALNTGSAPRYAFFKSPAPAAVRDYAFDGATGFGSYKTGRVFAIARLNGKPLAQEEVAIQLAPGESAEFDVFLPHRPISGARALKLREAGFAQRRAECVRYWKEKLQAGAGVRLPERRITEMIRAGLLHLDLVTYGLEPNSTLTSTIGHYSAIGSESSPIVQFMDSMGWHDTARRALMYFLDKQHEDGFIQNFGNYMLETGAALWSIGEHYRYTRDDRWVREIAPKLAKSCEYLQRWRERNKRDDLRGRGYGMLDGKTADPEDPFRSFMLNGYAYLGLQRVSEMLRAIDPAAAQRWAKEAAELKNDIRTAMFEAMGRSPAAPLGNGAWCPTLPPWPGYRGPLHLFADGGKWSTHGAVGARDSLLGPIYLIFQEVLDPSEPAAGFLLDFHSELMTDRNAAFSQPYYSRHPVAHLRRGEVKPFLKAYYNSVAALADRQTYTFWEHYFGASPHKTHEEAWFLMDTRWMLYMEQGDGLRLLPGIPRAYLEEGRQIELDRVASYFGPVSLRVDSELNRDRIRATVECPGDRKPRYVDLRLPHPLGRRASWVKGGTYDAASETVRIEPFHGRAEVVMGFGQER